METSFIRSMPKVELHVHLEGTMEPDLVRSLAHRNKVPVPASLLDRTSGYDFHDLTSFLAVYYPNMAVLLTSHDFHDLCWTYLTKCRDQNIIHTEMFFDPQAHTSRGVPFATVIEGIHSAMVEAESQLGVSASLIMCFLRDMDADSAMQTLNAAKPYKDWIIGVGLDSDERGNPPSKFAAVFKAAREQGYKLTCHCDIDQKNSKEHIRQVVEDIQVDRIDHGTNVIEDDGLVDAIVAKRIGLTCCPVSNSVVTRDFKGREMLELLRRGVLVTVNSDDPAYFRAYLNENVEKVASLPSIEKGDLIKLQRNALDISWLSDAKRKTLTDKLQEWERVTGSSL